MPDGAARAGRSMPNPSMQRGTARHRNGIPPSRRAAAVTTAAGVPSMPLRRRTHSRPRRSVPAACESSTSSRATRRPDRQRGTARNKLVELSIVEGAESPRQAAQRPDQPELRRHNVDQQREMRLLGELQAVLGLTLCLGKRIAAARRFDIQAGATESREGEVADCRARSRRRDERIAGMPEMLGPCQNEVSEGQIGPRLEAGQSTLFHQIDAEIAESKPRLIVAETRAGDRTEHNVRQHDASLLPCSRLRSTAENHQRAKVRVGEERRRHERC